MFVMLLALPSYDERQERTVPAPFHIAFPVDDLDAARSFYAGTLGCREGRSSSQWINFDLFGHQIVAHLKPRSEDSKAHHNPVDGHDVPVPHFGVVLSMEAWEALAERLRGAGVGFVIEPYIRFKGEVGERPQCSFSIPQAMHWSSRHLPTQASSSQNNAESD